MGVNHAARQQVIEANAGDMTDARPSTDTAKQQWRIVKERIIDLLEDWDDVVPPKRQAP